MLIFCQSQTHLTQLKYRAKGLICSSATKSHCGVNEKLHTFLTSVDGGKLSAWRYDRTLSRKNLPVTSGEEVEWNTTGTDLDAAYAGNWTLITFLSYFEK